MTRIKRLGQYFQRFAPPPSDQADERDQPPHEEAVFHTAAGERNAAWSATAIYGYVPYQAPQIR